MLSLLSSKLRKRPHHYMLNVSKDGVAVVNDYGYFTLDSLEFELPELEWMNGEEKIEVPSIGIGAGIWLNYTETLGGDVYDNHGQSRPFHSQYDQAILTVIKRLVPNASLGELKKLANAAINNRTKELDEFTNGNITLDTKCLATLTGALSFREDDEVLEWVDANNEILNVTVSELKAWVVAYNKYLSKEVIKKRLLKDKVLKCTNVEELSDLYVSQIED